MLDFVTIQTGEWFELTSYMNSNDISRKFRTISMNINCNRLSGPFHDPFSKAQRQQRKITTDVQPCWLIIFVGR
jgi:hypothetical protein